MESQDEYSGARRILEIKTLTIWREEKSEIWHTPTMQSNVLANAHVELGDELGRGATGVVYLGRVLETGDRLAVKQLCVVR